MHTASSSRQLLSVSSQTARDVPDVFTHSLMSLTIGMLGSAETSEIQSDVSVYWVTVSRDEAEFTKKRRSSETAELHTHSEKGFM